jgi:hypothetical protein
VIGGVLLLTLLGWALVWMSQPGWRRGSSIAGAVLAGSIVHACFVPIWHVPVVPLTLAALVGMASMRGGAASWRLAGLWEHLVEAEEVPPEDQSRWPTETREVDESTVIADEPDAGAATPPGPPGRGRRRAATPGRVRGALIRRAGARPERFVRYRSASAEAGPGGGGGWGRARHAGGPAGRELHAQP